MSIIIRLQNLPLAAKSGDIRRFFEGLRIPNGGVHIIGGKDGDAFISFASDEDARLAMRKDGGKILDVRVKLYLSSRVEMQQEISHLTKDEPAPEVHSTRYRSPFSRSPEMRSWSPRRSRSPRSTAPDRRSRSPRRSRSRSPRSMALEMRSRSINAPEMRSRSPMSLRNLMQSKYDGSAAFLQQEASSEKLVDIEKLFGVNKSSSTWKTLDFGRQEESANFEQKFAQALSNSIKSMGMYSKSGRADDDYLLQQIKSMRESSSSGMRTQDVRMDKPSANQSRGKTGNSNINIPLVGERNEPNISRQRERSIDRSMNVQGRSVEDFRMKTPAGHVSQQFSNLNTNQMPSRPQYTNSAVGNLPVQENSFIPNMVPASYAPEVRPLQYPTPMNIQTMVNVPPPVSNMPPPVSSMPPHTNMQIHTNIPPPSNIPPHSNMPLQTHIPPPPLNMHNTNVPPPNMQHLNMPMILNMPPPSNMPLDTHMPPPNNFPPPHSNVPPPMYIETPPEMAPAQNVPLQGFFVALNGLNPLWNSGDVQTMLKGLFLPTKNVKWNLDDKWCKTDTALVKLSNKDDFTQLLTFRAYSYLNKLITVGECPEILFRKYFIPEPPSEGHLSSEHGSFYYKISGLPYEATCDSVLNFFSGLEVIDLYIILSKCTQGYRILGKPLGLAFICFGNAKDASEGLAKNGLRFGNSKRIIKIESCTKKYFLEIKRKNVDFLSQSTAFVPVGDPVEVNVYPKSMDNNPMAIEESSFAIDKNSVVENQNSNEHRLCVLISGLPKHITKLRIINFFNQNKSNAGFVHHDYKNCQAYVEFYTLRDFQQALNCHGSKLSDETISINQVPIEEMLKAMDCKLPLCVLITGLPSNISKMKIVNLLKKNKSNPDCIHLLLNEQLKPNGQAFVEFVRMKDFGAALNCKRSKLGSNTIHVKQVVYGEMKKRLELQPRKTDNQSASSMTESQPDRELHLHMNENSRSHDKGSNSRPNNIQVMEYKSQTIQSLSVPQDKKPLKPCLKNTLTNAGLKSSEMLMSMEKPSQVIDLTEEPNEVIILESEDLKENADVEDASRIPVKFEVKIKPAISKSTKVEDAFDSTDSKKKLSKLSPERTSYKPSDPTSAAKKDQINNAPESDIIKSGKDIKAANKSTDKKEGNDKLPSNKTSDDNKTTKPKSLENSKNGNTKNADSKSKGTDDEKNSKNRGAASKTRQPSPEKSSRGSSSSHSSSRQDTKDSRSNRPRNPSYDQSSSRRQDEDRRRSPVPYRSRKRSLSPSPPRSRKRSLSPSPPRYSRYSSSSYIRSRSPLEVEAVVQLSNVDLSIGSAELLVLFCAYPIDPDKIIRRIDAQGHPTGDVRVHFKNRRVAELAIRKLSGTFLNGLCVDMFLVD